MSSVTFLKRSLWIGRLTFVAVEWSQKRCIWFKEFLIFSPSTLKCSLALLISLSLYNFCIFYRRSSLNDHSFRDSLNWSWCWISGCHDESLYSGWSQCPHGHMTYNCDIAASRSHIIAIYNHLCQIPTSKVSGEASIRSQMVTTWCRCLMAALIRIMTATGSAGVIVARIPVMLPLCFTLLSNGKSNPNYCH